ncbi:MAG: DUF1080 domain-containing protein [Isosphaeraceae bacterium]
MRAGFTHVTLGTLLLTGWLMTPTHNHARAEEDPPIEPGFVRLFNGKDLTGWRVRQTKEDLAGKTTTADGRFAVRDGAIVATGAAKIVDLDTIATFPRVFVLRLDFRASDRANSGLYIRGKQLQVRDYATIGPYTKLEHFKKGDWNAIEVIVRHEGGKRTVARCTCNGELLEAALEVPGNGPIGLQSETNQLEYRNIRLREIPDEKIPDAGAASR